MEYVPGGSLDRFWRSHGASVVPIETTVEIMRQVCRGLAVAHAGTPPIIHRDIKPQNILVGYEADGLRARVSDFGLAKKVNPLTLLATAAGTLAFKPPETFSNSKADSCAADVWALGVTTYLEKIPDMEEVSALLEAAKGDPDSANKAEKRLLELRIQLDKAEDLLKWPALVADANKALDDLDTLIEQHGNDDHRERAEKLREQIDELVEQKRSEPLRKKMEQVADVHREILFEQPGFWLGFFNYLVEERAKMSDQQSAERLINQGRQCINRGNVQGLRNVVAQLLGLLPRDVAETIQRGYQSGVLK
jgi:serine/threonine protein kinase